MTFSNFSLTHQSLMVLKELEEQYGWHKDSLPKDFEFKVYAMYNCREAGPVVECAKNWQDRTRRFVFFTESRNSDSIRVYTWEAETKLNPPTVDDMPEESWGSYESFSWGEYVQAAKYILNLCGIKD